MNEQNNISQCQKSYSEDYLLKYINNELSDEESAVLETHLQECEVCSDQLDGLLMMENPEEVFAVSAELNKLIDSKSKAKRKVLGMEPNSFRAIAAVFILLMISGAYVILNNLINDNEITNVNKISQIENPEGVDLTDKLDQRLEEDSMIADVKTAEEKNNKSTVDELFERTATESENNQQVFFDLDVPSSAEQLEDVLLEEEIVSKIDEIPFYYAPVIDEMEESEAYINVANAELEVIDNEDFADEDKVVYKSDSDQDESSKDRTVSTVSVASKETRSGFWGNMRRENKKESVAMQKSNNRPSVNTVTTQTTVTGNSDVSDGIGSGSNSSIVTDNYGGISPENSDSADDMAEEQVIEEAHETVIEELIIVEDDVEIVLVDDFTEFEEEVMEEPLAFHVVEEKPQFPGGEHELMKYIADNFELPLAQESQIGGKIYVQFVITKTGKVDDVKVVKGVDPYLDQEAIRVVENMPDWIPGKQRGKAVDVTFVIPINITLY